MIKTVRRSKEERKNSDFENNFRQKMFQRNQ